jgi:hypothetical protein
VPESPSRPIDDVEVWPMTSLMKPWSTTGRRMATAVLIAVPVGVVLGWQGGDVGEFGGIILSCVAMSLVFTTIYFILWLGAVALLRFHLRPTPLKVGGADPSGR